MISLPADGKIFSIQYLRGLAALGVVLCHYCASLTIQPAIKKAFTFGQTGVYVFFLISGFIIVYALLKENYRPGKFFIFLLKRSIRIDPAYYATLLVTVIILKYLATISPVQGSSFNFVPQQLLAHLLYAVPFTKYAFYMHVFWTLCIEFQFYVLVGLLYFISNSSIYQSVFLIVFSLLSFIHLPNAEYLVFTYSPIFAAGMSLVTFHKNRLWQNAITPFACLLLAGYHFGWPISLLLIATCAAVLFVKFPIKPLSFLGDISYSFYLTHTLTLLIIDIVLKKIRVNINDHAFFWLIAEVLFAIIPAWCLYQLVEKPSMKLSKNFFYNRGHK